MVGSQQTATGGVNMRRYAVNALLLAVIFLFAGIPSKSEIRLYGGKYNDPDNWFAGAGFRIGLLPIIDIIPNYEYVFVDHGHFSTLSVDGTITFLVVGYAGIGAACNFAGGEGTDSKTNAAFNLIGGINLRAVPLSPFVQVKYVTISGGGDTWLVGAGIHF
jgi:hypothetical protein